MKTVCIGGGPAGLYLGVLLKLAQPRHQVTVFERNRPDDTFGFGVVFSDATLGNLAEADPVTHEAITARFARWDDIETHVRGHVFTSTGHGFCGIERKQLLLILQDRARELGVDVRFEHNVTSLDEVKDAGLVVACDGVASWVRDALSAQFEPDVDVRPNKFVWLGTTVPFTAFTFIFKETAHGLFRVHAYRYSESGSTFIVECTPATWKAAGLEGADEDRTIAVLEDLFAAELGGHRLIKNRSIWRNFPTVRNKRWRAGNVVLMGDAAHTAHFSIGSGTKLAMEDAIALRDAIVAEPDVETALATYEMRRRPEVEALQAAAQASLEWFEGTERYLGLPPAQFGYSLMTRSLRVSHASMLKRDPSLARAVERVLAERAQLELAPEEAAPPPMFTPVELAGLRLPNRIALAPWPAGAVEGGVIGDGHLVFLGARATGGAGLVLTEPVAASGTGATPAIGTDEQAVAWRRVVEFVHEKSPAKIGIVVTVGAGLEDAARRAAFAGFDLLLLDGEDGIDGALTAARTAWPSERPLGVRVRRAADASKMVAQASAWRALGATVLAVAPGTTRASGARLDAAPLADRVRNELDLAVILEDAAATPADVDAVIAAGRCDVVALGRALVVDPGFVERAAEAAGWRRTPPDARAMSERMRHGAAPRRVRRTPQRYQLDKRGVELVHAGHPWIFRGNVSTAASALADGQWLALYDGKNHIVGHGVYAAVGAIAIRVLSRGEERPRGPYFGARIDEALAKRAPLRAETNGFRAVHGESDGVPAVTADVYGDILVVQSYASGVEALARLVARRVAAAVGARAIVFRGGHRTVGAFPDDKRGPRVLAGQLPGQAPFREGPLALVAHPYDGQKGGTFLDLRGLRRWVAAQPLAGKRVLNLFAYTGMLGLAAEHAGAARIVQVDRSPALGTARLHHMRDPAKHETITADIFDWLPGATGDYELVIVDPPSMTSRIEQVPGVLATYRRLHKAAAARVAPGGALVLACCTSRVTRAQFRAVVANLPPPGDAGRWELEADLPAEIDHPAGFAEADYLKIMILRRA